MRVPCKIQILSEGQERVLIIRTPTHAVSDVITLFAALHLDKIQSIPFADKDSKLTFTIFQQKTEKKHMDYAVKFCAESYPISKNSLEALAALMVDVSLHGWSHHAHMDLELKDTLSLCFTVEPPSQ